MRKKPEQVDSDQLELMLSTLQSAILLLQESINKEIKKGNLDVVATTKVFKLISDSLGQVYKIRCGKAAQDRIIQQIGELQVQMSKVEEINAERERRARSKPLIEIIGDLVPEEEIRVDDPDESSEEHNRPMLPRPEAKETMNIEKAVETGIRERRQNGTRQRTRK